MLCGESTPRVGGEEVKCESKKSTKTNVIKKKKKDSA